ncbi:hypothetical protein ACFOOM_12255 [Streptomyces echinoruber]|uniref:Uncharacterized protein n=1 Tax=Streptomyces echinoruber TaxID=68898 RepID=A0A918RL47_9ACTN|nr:hypothetical protein [Streptomyces echinoruber]GHA01310.1 hypothetical protein GCM10010389_45820 [Streptomyces echinoruber]
MSARDENFGPTEEKLRWAGVELRAARMLGELENQLSATWRGRLAPRLARWYARRKR